MTREAGNKSKIVFARVSFGPKAALSVLILRFICSVQPNTQNLAQTQGSRLQF